MSLLTPLAIWFVSFVDRFILWRLPRDLFYRYSITKRLLSITKYTLHYLSGASELRRLVENEFISRGTRILDPSSIKPSVETIMLFASIMKRSSSLKRIWFIIKGGMNEKSIDEVSREVIKIKGIPTRNPWMSTTKACLTRLMEKYRLMEDINKIKSKLVDIEKDKDHFNLLVRLWKGLKGDDDVTKVIPPIPDEQWKELGFQGINPATDFRATGLFGLEQLIFFAEFEGNKYRKIYDEAQNGPYWYSFAIVGINATNAIWTFLKTDQLDRFLLAGQIADLDVIHRLYCELLVIFHHEWMTAKPDNLLAFNGIFSQALIKFKSVFLDLDEPN